MKKLDQIRQESKEIKDKADMYLSQLNTATISASLKAEILSFIESVLND